MPCQFAEDLAMSTILPDAPPSVWTIADVQSRFPGFPADRIRTCPSPGLATEEDVLKADRICELIDGTLVEKTMATYESIVALALAYFLNRYLDDHNIGTLAGEAGLLKILPSQVRAPDVSFIRWERLPGRGSPKPPIYAVAPDLAAEILSESNTEAEMDRKLQDYFTAGVRLVWYIDPATRTAQAFTAADQRTDIAPHDSLTGGDVLPGFELPLPKLFARADGPSL
jgi:Uma2 family endonuclease